MRTTNNNKSSETFNELQVTNNAAFAVCIRVYEESEAINEQTGLRAISDVRIIERGKTIQIKLNTHIDSNRILCFLNSDIEKQAKSKIFRESEFAPCAKSIEIPKYNSSETWKLEIPNFDPVPEVPDYNWLELQAGLRLLNEFRAGLSAEKLKLNPHELEARAQKSRRKETGVAEIAYSRSNERNISLSETETNNLAERSKVVNHAVKNLLEQCGITNLAHKTPMMGLSGSGGGFRAMIGFRGFITGLYEGGLADTLHYCSGTSGSTWAMMELRILSALAEKRVNFDQYLNLFPKTISSSMKHGIYQSWESVVSANNIYGKLIKEQLLRVNDSKTTVLTLWSARLSMAALSGVQELNLKLKSEGNKKQGKLGKDVRQLTASKIAYFPEIGPIQIYNAIAASSVPGFETDFVDLFEFNGWDMTLIPDERAVGTYCAWRVPAEAFGKSFSGSIASGSQGGVVPADTGDRVPVSTGKWIGTTGSAMTPAKNRILNDVGEKLRGYSSHDKHRARLAKSAPSIQKADIKNLQGTMQTGVMHGQTITAPLPNISGNQITLRDAGLFCNNPIYALLRRGCDIITVYDTSGGLNDKDMPCYELLLSVENAKSLNKKLCPELSSLPEDTTAFFHKIRKSIDNAEYPIVFGNPEDPEEVCIVYIPTANTTCKLFKDSKMHWNKFEPENVSTMKLNYNSAEIDTLYEYGRLLSQAVDFKLKEIIVRRTIALNNLVPHDESVASFVVNMALTKFISLEGLKSIIEIVNPEYFIHISEALSTRIKSSLDKVQIQKLKNLFNYVNKSEEARIKINEHVIVMRVMGVTPIIICRLLIDVLTYSNSLSPLMLTNLINDAIAKTGMTENKEVMRWVNLIISCLNSNEKEYSDMFVQILTLLNLGNINDLMEIVSHFNNAYKTTKMKWFSDMANDAGILYDNVKRLRQVVCQSDVDHEKSNVDGDELRSKDVSTVNNARSIADLNNLYKSTAKLSLNTDIVHSGVYAAAFDIVCGTNVNTRLMNTEDIIGAFLESDDPACISAAMKNLLSLIKGRKQGNFRVEFYECLINLINQNTESKVVYDLYLQLSYAYRDQNNVTKRYRALKQALNIYKGGDAAKEMEELIEDVLSSFRKSLRSKSLDEMKTYFEIVRSEDKIPDNILCYAAAKNIQEDKFEYLLKNIDDRQIKYCNKNGWNAAHFAAKDDNTVFIHLLLDRNSELFNEATTSGMTPVLIAAEAGSDKSFELMQKKLTHKQISKADKNGWNAVHHAAKSNSDNILQSLISYPAMFDCITSDGKPAATVAVIEGSNKALLWLCRAKKGVNLSDDSNHPPIYYACIKNNPDAFNILLDHGATYDNFASLLLEANEAKAINIMQAMLLTVKDEKIVPRQLISQKDIDELSQSGKLLGIWQQIFRNACQNGKYDYVDYLLNQGIINEKTSKAVLNLGLIIAYHNDDIFLFKKLIAKSANPNVIVNKDTGDSLLLDAYKNKEKKSTFLECLLTAKADPDAKNKKGETCLSWSYYMKDIDYFRKFLSFGAKCNDYPSSHLGLLEKRGTNSANLLVQACLSKGSEEYIKLMLAHPDRFNVNIEVDGINPLSAVYYYMPDMFGYLLEAGANPNAKYSWSEADNSVLLEACSEGKKRTEFVRLICSEDCKVEIDHNIVNRDKKSALLLAYCANDDMSFEYLLNAGADPKIKVISESGGRGLLLGWSRSKVITETDLVDHARANNRTKIVELLENKALVPK